MTQLSQHAFEVPSAAYMGSLFRKGNRIKKLAVKNIVGHRYIFASTQNDYFSRMAAEQCFLFSPMQ